MTTEQGTATTRKLPLALLVAINVGIVFHLLALGVLAMSARNGPWAVRYLSMQGGVPSEGPPFATAIAQWTTRNYLQPLSLAGNYRFTSIITDSPTIYLEVAGQPKSRGVKFPDARANMWVQGRQRLLVNVTGDDSPYQARMAQPVLPDQTMPDITFLCHPHEAVMLKLQAIKDIDFTVRKPDGQVDTELSRKHFRNELAHLLDKDELDRYQDEILKVLGDTGGKTRPGEPPVEYRLIDPLFPKIASRYAGQTMYLYQQQEHSMPKAQVLFTPSHGTLILVRSYARYLTRLRGEDVELVRLHRNPVAPLMMFSVSPMEPNKLLIDSPPYSLETFSSYFGDGVPRKWSSR